MKFYLIVSDREGGITSEQQKSLESLGEVITISHKGKLASITQLTQDQEEKILALDPTCFDWELDVETLDRIPKVKAVITQSTSFDWFHPKELKARGILACNCPGFSSESVAEYALCMAIEAARNLAVYVKNGWKIDSNAKSMLLRGKTVGILGLGRIGKCMAEVMSGIGMKVIYWSRKSKDNRFSYVELTDLFKSSDVLMPALVENEETNSLITKKLIDTMKSSAIVVGIGRVKALLPEEYIIEKVAKGELAGYALEGDNSKELSAYKGNVWALPPMAWYTNESLQNLLQMWVDNMVAVAQGKPQNVIN
jgi:lactate dehydrogenase-like 2-hydroxyacid dehydrogenase